MGEKRIFKVIGKNYHKLREKSQLKLSDDNIIKEIPKYSGVYVFYDKKRPLYVGISKNIHNRFKKHLSGSKKSSSSTLRAELHKRRKIKYKDTRNWLLKNCTIKLIEIKHRDDALLFEHFLIKLWRKKYRKNLLNPYKW